MASTRLRMTATALAPLQKRQFTHLTYNFTSPYTNIFAPNSKIKSVSVVHWGWSHIFLFPGKDIKLDSSFEPRQAWSFSVEADEEFAKDEKFEEEAWGQYGMKASGSGVEDPKDLSAQLEYWVRPRSNRLWVLNFLNFTRSDALGRYKEHLAEKKDECGLKVHLFGEVTHMSRVERWQEPRVEYAEKTDAFALLSFPGEREYAGFLLLEQHRRLIKGPKTVGEVRSKEDVGLMEEGMILTKEMRLPPKDQEINQYGWQYGNPYEPFGEDFFG